MESRPRRLPLVAASRLSPHVQLLFSEWINIKLVYVRAERTQARSSGRHSRSEDSGVGEGAGQSFSSFDIDVFSRGHTVPTSAIDHKC